MNRNGALPAFLPGLYAVAALLVIAPLVDVFGASWPLRPVETAWRFGSIGLGLGVVLVQVIGFALALGVAAALDHRGVLRLVGAVSVLFAGILIAGITRFVLDYTELRSVMSATEASAFEASAFRAVLVATLCAPVLLALGGRAWSVAGARSESAAMDVPAPAPQRRAVIPFPRSAQNRLPRRSIR
jgi:hypothetical protein